jgi:hypothetical protein
MVTVTGFVHALTTGPDTNGLSVAFYQAAPLIAGQDIGAATPIAQAASVPLKPETQRACDANPPFGCSLPATCEVPCADGLDGRPDLSKYCLAGADGSTSCADRLRWEARYTVTNVPTNKQLVVRVAAANGQSDQNWVQLVTWNVYLPSNARACVSPDDNNCRSANGTYQLDVSALSRSAYWNIPRAAGLSGGITTGLGAILGEVRDCNDVRVQNVAVTTTALADRLAYFKSTPTGPQPDAALLATAQPGLYAALNLKPGRTTVITAGLVNDTLTSFGSFDAFVYANTVSLVNINGGNPRP